MGIKIIDMAVNVDHVHMFFQYPRLKYSLSYIAKSVKVISGLRGVIMVR